MPRLCVARVFAAQGSDVASATEANEEQLAAAAEDAPRALKPSAPYLLRSPDGLTGALWTCHYESLFATVEENHTLLPGTSSLSIFSLFRGPLCFPLTRGS